MDIAAWLPWIRRRAQQAHQVAVAAEAAQDAERTAARQRLLDLSRQSSHWHRPTSAYPVVAPLLTRGQEWRTSGGDR